MKRREFGVLAGTNLAAAAVAVPAEAASGLGADLTRSAPSGRGTRMARSRLGPAD